MLGSAPWDTISVFASFSSCFHDDFDGIRSLVPFVAVGARLSWLSPLPTSSGLVWSFWWSALPHVLWCCVLFGILWCYLRYILRLRFPYLFCFFSYVLPYVFLFLHQFYYGLQVTCSYEAFWHEEAWGFQLACSSRLGIDTCFYSLVPRRLVSSLFQFDRHSVAWPCLPRSWDPPAFWLRRCFSLRDCRCVPWWLFCTFASHLPLSGTSLAKVFFFRYSTCGICSRHCVPLVGFYVSLFPSTLPRSLLWHIPPSKSK